MKKSNYLYSNITSFEDFDLEQERLLMKQKLIEARLSYSIKRIETVLSVTNVLFSLAKEFVFPKTSNILSSFIQKMRG